MFTQLFAYRSIMARHETAPYADERRRYLAYCAERGDARSTLRYKARELLWIARKLQAYPDLNVTREQIQAVAGDWAERARVYGRPLVPRWTNERFLVVARPWLRYLGYLRPVVAPFPFGGELAAYAAWARDERGLCESTIAFQHRCVVQFLRWYGGRSPSLAALQVGDIDAYLARGSTAGWSRVTVHNVAASLRAFCRYAATRGWINRGVPGAIHGPRRYALAALPAGPAWPEVQRLLAAADTARPKDVRDRAILLLFTLYGLRGSEVARLRLEDLDWEHDRLQVARVKRRTRQAYPLVPVLGNALIKYLQTVRPASPHREVFLRLLSPVRPLTRSALYHLVADRLRVLGVRTAHAGPHALRHACAGRLVAAGLSLKAIGDHLGHRSAAATRIYAKVDLPGLRAVAAFDLGGVR